MLISAIFLKTDTSKALNLCAIWRDIDQNIDLFYWAWDWNPSKFRIILKYCRNYFLKIFHHFWNIGRQSSWIFRVSIIATTDFEIHRSAHQLVTKIRSTADQWEIRCEQIFRRCPRIAHNRQRSPAKVRTTRRIEQSSLGGRQKTACAPERAQ